MGSAIVDLDLGVSYYGFRGRGREWERKEFTFPSICKILEPFIIVFVAEKGERESFTFTSICIDEENTKL